jgi:hypothetical protein
MREPGGVDDTVNKFILSCLLISATVEYLCRGANWLTAEATRRRLEASRSILFIVRSSTNGVVDGPINRGIDEELLCIFETFPDPDVVAEEAVAVPVKSFVDEFRVNDPPPTTC